MQDELAILLWRRRMSSRLQLIRDIFKLIVDFWTALYIIIPAIILFVVIYRDLLAGLPAWFQPQWAVFLVLIFSFFLVKGNQRCYLNEADLIFVQPGSRSFQHLFRLGLRSSLAINNILTLFLIMALYPFYLHLEAVSVYAWLWIGLWIIILRTSFLFILFWLQDKRRQIICRALFFFAFFFAWNRVLVPFIQTDKSMYLFMLLGIAVFMLALAMLAKVLWPIRNWEKIVQAEAHYNIHLMSQLLGHQAAPAKKRNGSSLWSQKRLGIPFRRDYTLTYFYTKYILRQKPILQIFLEIFTVCLLVVISSDSFWFMLGFLAVADFMLGLLVKSVVADNAGKLDLFTPGLDITAGRKGLRILYIMIMIPLAILPVYAVFSGVLNGLQLIAGMFTLLLWVFISAQLLLDFTRFKQYLIK